VTCRSIATSRKTPRVDALIDAHNAAPSDSSNAAGAQADMGLGHSQPTQTDGVRQVTPLADAPNDIDARIDELVARPRNSA